MPPSAESISLTQTPPPGRLALPNPLGTLFVISFVGLFLELLLIRWVSTEIRIFAYLQNTVLVVCFLGLGMGCWDCRKPFALGQILLPLFILAGLLAVPQSRQTLGRISEMLNGFGGLVIWGGESMGGWKAIGAPAFGLLLTFGLMLLIWDMFVPIGRLLGRRLADYPEPIRAYSVNVAGSLLGIWAFVACSAADLPPVGWFAVFALGCLPFLGTGTQRLLDLALLAGIVAASVAAGWDPGYPETHWSPYQKLSVRPVDPSHPQPGDLGAYRINVNNISYQEIIDLRPDVTDSKPDVYPPALRGLSQYDLPCKLHPRPGPVLVVGAGSGNDVAGALRNGANRVVAVEIDPVILEIGKKYHPEKPYADPRVEVVNNDARSYFETCTEKFDVILFGLLDSHTTTTMTNARLDHYVYTLESISRAKSLLADGGIIFLSFFSDRPFITNRMAGTLRGVFGQESLMFPVTGTNYGRGGMVFVQGDLAAVHRRLAADPAMAHRIELWRNEYHPEPADVPRGATDDWPYIYLEKPQIPVLYFLLAGLLAVLFLVGLYRLGNAKSFRSWDASSWQFFFLGAAFMLLEVQNVSKAAVVLGNTWLVNAVVISGILCMILVANSLTVRFPRLSAGGCTIGILAACVVLYRMDLAAFGFLPYPIKAVVVGGFVSLPMLFSGVVFARSFAAAPRKDTALGANLFGSLVGGVLQSVTFVTGIKALLLIVAALYVAAWLTRTRRTPATGTEPKPERAAENELLVAGR
jgi:spermidine synthase